MSQFLKKNSNKTTFNLYFQLFVGKHDFIKEVFVQLCANGKIMETNYHQVFALVT